MRAFSRNHLLLGALMAVAIAVPALAQQPAAAVSKYPECAANFTASQNEQDAARGAWLAGKAAFDEADYAKAIDYFKDAYKRDCTKHVLLREWIARAYEAKGDKAEAINALETYLARMPKADDAEQVRKRIENLKAQLAPANTNTAPTATGRDTTPTATTTTTAPTATATDTATPPPATGGHSIIPWVVVGGGGAALVGGVIMLVIGSGKVSDSKAQCPNNVCAPSVLSSAQSLNKSGYALETVGLIVGGLGVAGVAGGLVWHFIEPTGEKKAAFAPVITPGYAGGAFSYKF